MYLSQVYIITYYMEHNTGNHYSGSWKPTQKFTFVEALLFTEVIALIAVAFCVV